MKTNRLIELVVDTLTQHQSNVDVVPLGLLAPEFVRQNDVRPAQLRLHVPDDWVKNLKGKVKLMDAYILIRIDRERVDRFNSPLVLP